MKLSRETDVRQTLDQRGAQIIAEVGSNHNRSLSLALGMIDMAVDAGASAVKFQVYDAATLYSARNDALHNYGGSEITNLIDRVKTPREWLPELSSYCREKKIEFFATPFDMRAVDELDEVSGLFKIASFEIVDIPLIRKVASKGKPIFISTGMATMGEIEDAVDACLAENNDSITLMQCVSSYPAPAEIMNLRSMETMRRAFGFPVGLSDHTLGIHVTMAAVAMGATAVEKHVTMDRRMEGPDHAFAIEPHELKELVRQIREVERAMGDGLKRGPSEAEIGAHGFARRSLHALVDIPKGTRITQEMLISKRPGYGVRPKHIGWLTGRRAGMDIAADSWITMEMLD